MRKKRGKIDGNEREIKERKKCSKPKERNKIRSSF